MYDSQHFVIETKYSNYKGVDNQHVFINKISLRLHVDVVRTLFKSIQKEGLLS